MPDSLYHALLLFPLFLLTTAGGCALGKRHKAPGAPEKVDGTPTLDQLYRGQKIWWFRRDDGASLKATVLEVVEDGIFVQNDAPVPEGFRTGPCYVSNFAYIRPRTDDTTPL
jgi:hypothetical protein